MIQLKYILPVTIILSILISTYGFILLMFTNHSSAFYRIIILLFALTGTYLLARKNNLKYLQILNIVCIVLEVVTIELRSIYGR